MTPDAAARYCLARAEEQAHGPAAAYWRAVAAACRRIIQRTQGART